RPAAVGARAARVSGAALPSRGCRLRPQSARRDTPCPRGHGPTCLYLLPSLAKIRRMLHRPDWAHFNGRGMASYTTERVIEVQHWSDKLFSFRTTRGAALRFDNGQFIMVGLEGGGRKIVRAYS